LRIDFLKAKKVTKANICRFNRYISK